MSSSGWVGRQGLGFRGDLRITEDAADPKTRTLCTSRRVWIATNTVISYRVPRRVDVILHSPILIICQNLAEFKPKWPVFSRINWEQHTSLTSCNDVTWGRDQIRAHFSPWVGRGTSCTHDPIKFET
ncbi:hypothetical protein Hypma_003210 [Hypsizygus marmoreus]|uniref:Uncharacterized protein n=1 Tax=Hypsizygus marmoreus TaxID=39966 RepID=A0A369K9S6_HYPMA|nr:hypothetical protein Hypma_003210 [Hypsizygus marmoreus]